VDVQVTDVMLCHFLVFLPVFTRAIGLGSGVFCFLFGGVDILSLLCFPQGLCVRFLNGCPGVSHHPLLSLKCFFLVILMN
jgi:hypothetical protein